MHLAKLYQETVQKFLAAGIEEARSDTDQLLGFCLGMSRSQLFLSGEKEINTAQLALCETYIERRLTREPLHYILGRREFWSLDFIVTSDVLIPRPETEFLVEKVLETLKIHGYKGGSIVDMCTGSGVIAVVLSLELKAHKVLAVDVSERALSVADANVARHGKTEDITLLCSDLFSAIASGINFELIVSNPPYIAQQELTVLQPEVRDWEPKKALAAGEFGLDIINKLAGQVHEFLAPGGWFFMEIGADQGKMVHDVFSGHSSRAYDCVEIINDLSQRPRVLKARKGSM